MSKKGSLKYRINSRLKEFDLMGNKQPSGKIRGALPPANITLYRQIGLAWAAWAKENTPDLVAGRPLSGMQESARLYLLERIADGASVKTVLQEHAALALLMDCTEDEIKVSVSH